MKTELSYIVFTDFDGTMTHTDIGGAMFQHFGNKELCNEYFQMYRTGKISARECWQRACATVQSLTRTELINFSEQHSFDMTFSAFASYCEGKNIPIVVVSDGFDVYINHLLAQHNCNAMPRYANSLIFSDDNTVVPHFPHTDAECSRCANCKRNHLLTHANDENIIVYIGNGYSDQCPVRFADIVFAKDSLVSFCEKENITYHRFGSFRDVLSKFQIIVEQTKPRKRRTAELARQDVFKQG